MYTLFVWLSTFTPQLKGVNGSAIKMRSPPHKSLSSIVVPILHPLSLSSLTLCFVKIKDPLYDFIRLLFINYLRISDVHLVGNTTDLLK